MAFSFADYVASNDVAVTWLNSLKTKVAAILNSFPGGNIVAGSITQAKLAKGKANQTWSFCQGKAIAATSLLVVDARTALNVDGASNSSFRITGYSFHSGITGAGPTKGAGNLLYVSIAGVRSVTIDLNAAGLAIGVPVAAALSPAVSFTSGQVITVEYVYGGVAGSYPTPRLDLDVTVNHVST